MMRWEKPKCMGEVSQLPAVMKEHVIVLKGMPSTFPRLFQSMVIFVTVDWCLKGATPRALKSISCHISRIIRFLAACGHQYMCAVAEGEADVFHAIPNNPVLLVICRCPRNARGTPSLL